MDIGEAGQRRGTDWVWLRIGTSGELLVNVLMNLRVP
jgi:hypothetical protein